MIAIFQLNWWITWFSPGFTPLIAFPQATSQNLVRVKVLISSVIRREYGFFFSQKAKNLRNISSIYCNEMLKKKNTARSKFARPQKANMRMLPFSSFPVVLTHQSKCDRCRDSVQILHLHRPPVGKMENYSVTLPIRAVTDTVDARRPPMTKLYLSLWIFVKSWTLVGAHCRNNTPLTETRSQIKRQGSCSFSSNNDRIVGDTRKEWNTLESGGVFSWLR